MDGIVIGVDIGGTKVLAGVVDAEGAVLRTATRGTPGRLVEESLVEDALTEAVEEAAAGAGVQAVGVAAAGFVDAAGERIRFAPHLPWRDAPLRTRLAARWGVPVVLENDATAAALAEVRYGAARGASDAVVVTLGTGVGGGLVLGGRLHRGAQGMAGEFGHMQVVPDGQPCECGGRGCWEQYASGNALVRHVRSRLGAAPTVLAEWCGGDPAALDGPMVSRAAEAGDAVALEALGQVGDWLGVGLANLVAAFDPQVVVVGGGVAAAGERLLEPARAALARSLVGAAHRDVPTVVIAQLGPAAGLVGTATLAREAGQNRR